MIHAFHKSKKACKVKISPSKTLLELELELKPLRHSHQYPRIKFYFSFHHKGLPAGLQSGVITSTVFVHYRNYGKLNSTQ
jgi:hypothetical protein